MTLIDFVSLFTILKPFRKPKISVEGKRSSKTLNWKSLSSTMSGAKKNEYGDSGKYVSFTDGDGKKACVSINQKAIDNDLTFAGYNLLVTSSL